MPGMLEDTREILGYLASLSRDTYVNVMDQYYPAWKAKTTYQELNRRLAPGEVATACAYARERGLWRLDRRWRRVAPKLGL
jgi:putative pyruvate formate lyase activating enzyme